MTPQAFIFDCDGTLIDSMGMWLTIYPELVARYGIHMTPEDFAPTEHLALPEEMAYYHEKLGIAQSGEALLAELRGMIREKYAHDHPLCPGVRPFLEAAAKAGIPLGIATSTDADLVTLALERLGVAGLFRVLVTTDEAGASKERPDVYDLALSRLAPGARPQDAWVFEDAMFGLKAARGAGYHTLGVYDAHGRADRAVVRANASIFVTSFEQLALADVLSFDPALDAPGRALPAVDLAAQAGAARQGA